MSRNAYVDVCLAVQAVRRQFERLRTPAAPALGVGASIYTHQVANVLRVLTDVRVRHLLADEVGLGKTVQALMVLNALRSQRRDLRALIVVPDRLVPQWRDEIMMRAHTAPFGESEDFEGDQYIRLAWEAQLRMTDAAGNPRLALADIDPRRFDMLVVDELHRLRADLQDRVVRAAADFEHVLVLTATPAFQRIDRHAQLFALLEPERTAVARWGVANGDRGAGEELAIGDDLSKWPAWAATTVVDDLLERDQSAANLKEGADATAVAMTHCAYRRVIRTRREDYSGVLPRRTHRPIVVEPLGAEVERQSLMWQYLGLMSDRFDPVLLAKRVILSPPSLQQRVDFFRRKGQEREGLLERAKPLVHRCQGDSRADALVDLLAAVWARDPDERVLVAAQDNLTVDYLFELVQARLPEVGPLYAREPLVAARLRQGMMTEAVEDLGGYGNETNENLEAFQRGDAQVLFAPEAAQVGLNLQCARVLVLYSVPWRPEEVEQWIGRLDRIGNAAAFSNEGEAKTVDVYTIAQQGLVDEKVVTVLQRFHVFERSVNLDGEHLEEVASLIEGAALRPDTVNWADLEARTEAMAAEDEVQELDSALRRYLPWTVRWATSERQRLDGFAPAVPVLVDLPGHASTGPRAWDRAFEGMVKLLSRSGDYHVRWNTDPDTGGRFRTLWYRFEDRGMFGRRRQKEVCSKVILSFGADPGHERHPRNAHAFITRRGDITTPPQRSVTMRLDDEDVRRPLRFASFGDPLHDELVAGWLPAPGSPTQALDVTFFDDHSLWEHGAPALYLVRVAWVDPASALLGREVEDRTLEAVASAVTHSDLDRLLDLVRPFTDATLCALEADVRWLRAQLSAAMRLDVRKRVDGQWATVDPAEAAALLNPLAHGRNGSPRASEIDGTPEFVHAIQDAFARMRRDDSSAADQAWSHRLPDFGRALEARLAVVREEGHDAVALAGHVLEAADAAWRTAMDGGNRGQITRTENARDAAADTRDMVEVFWRERARWLAECEAEVRSVLPVERLSAVIRARRGR